MIKVSKADVLRLMGLWAGTMNSYMKFMGYLDSVAVFIDLFQIQWDKQACHGLPDWLTLLGEDLEAKWMEQLSWLDREELVRHMDNICNILHCSGHWAL